MKKLFLLLILLAAFQASALAQNKQIDAIRRIYQETNKKINDAEKAFSATRNNGNVAETEIFLLETLFNKGNTSYPAVGIFREDAKFYFTFGKSDNPYPERLLKIIIVTYRSAAVEHREYLFDSAGQLIFYFEDPDSENMDRSEETRLYFANENLIRFQAGDDDITNKNFRRKNEIVREVLEKQKKLVSIFKNSQ